MTALRSLVDHHDVTWIASALGDEDRAVAEESGQPVDEFSNEGSPYRLRLVAHDPDAFHRFYNVVANPTLWFVQHYLWGLSERPCSTTLSMRPGRRATSPSIARSRAPWWPSSSASPTQRSSSSTTTSTSPRHSSAGPSPRRRSRVSSTSRGPSRTRGPSSPGRSAAPCTQGLLANDVVGFHRRWVRNFLRSCEDIVGVEVDFDRDETEYAGRTVAVRQAAISVDPDEFAGLAESEAVLEAEREEARAHPARAPRRPRRPRSPSKNVVRGFRSFELFLESHEGWHGRVGMLALLDPSRQDIPEYAEYLVAIRRAAREVNDRFATADWTPLELRISDSFGSVAAYKQFDVLLVNAIFDGLNLVAKEAPLVNARDGVLVLGEHRRLRGARGVALGVQPHSTWPARHVRSTRRSRWRLQSGADVARRSATGCASTTIERWIGLQLDAIDEARDRAGRTLETS